MRGSGRATAAAITAYACGLGFGLPCVVAIRHLIDTGRVWRFLGFPTYGDGPFDSVGMHTTVPLLAGFLAVCAAELALALLIQRRSLQAELVSSLLLPIELAYAVGFALPAGVLLVVARVALMSRLPSEARLRARTPTG
jgi:hypothetical protein